jgi:hypothetical protein
VLFLVTASAFAVVDVSKYYTFRFLGENLALFTVALFFYLFIRDLDRNTMYYGSFFAANAILGMFGGWVRGVKFRIDVQHGNVGKQEFRIHRDAGSSLQGPHRQFWDFFYGACNQLVPFVEPAEEFALRPISGNPTWLIERRNEINYDSAQAIGLCTDFLKGSAPHQIPSRLPGTMSTQFRVLEELLTVACKLARMVGLRTDGLDALSPSGELRKRIRTLIYDIPVPTARKARRREIAS